jgi:hypothetical protein
MNFLNSLLDAGWIVWFLIVAVIIFILWLFVGGGDYEYVGLSPLKIGVDSTKYVNEQAYNIIDRGNYYAEKVTRADVTSDSSDLSDTSANKFQFKPSTNKGTPSKFKCKYTKDQICQALGNCKQYKNNKLSKGEQKCKERNSIYFLYNFFAFLFSFGQFIILILFTIT